MDNKIKLLDEIIKEMYPDAFAIKIFVNYREIKIKPTYKKVSGIPTRSLSGK